MANLMALAVARDVHLRELRGLDRAPRGADLEGVRVYASDQTHFSVERGLDILGFPEGTLRVVASDEPFRLRPEPVAAAIGGRPCRRADPARDQRRRRLDEHRVGRRCARARRGWPRDEGCWLHVDAAYGGAARLSERDARRVPGLELADSVTVDPHKWFFQAYDIGALVVRRRRGPAATRSTDAPEYYASNRRRTRR